MTDSNTTAVRLTRRELVLIVAFWTFMALLMSANRLLDPRGQGLRSTASSAFVALAFIEAYLWALLTPVVFWLASRYSVERGSRAARVALLLVAGVVIAIAIDSVMGMLRPALLPPPPGPRRGTPMTFLSGARRLWFLNELMIYMGVLAAGLARDFSLRYRARQEESVQLAAEAARLEAQLAEARLDALRRQLDPHFLFNTLHAISSLVERDPRGVRRMISRLSELLRHSIEGATEQEIPLDRELDLLTRYVEIMQIRFQGRLEVTTDIEARAREALVPNLILQPIVENAIKHGSSRVEGVGRVELRAIVEGNDLVLRVRDNGPGDSEPSEPASTGVGIRNTVARLEQLYGDASGFTLRTASEGGAVAELRIPYHVAADLRAIASASEAG